MKVAVCFSTVLFGFFVGCSTNPEMPNPATSSAQEATPLNTVYGAKVIHLDVPNRLTDLQMRQAIQNAAFENGWTVTESDLVDGEGMVSIYKKSVFAETTFTFLFGPGNFSGYSDSYTLDVTGKRTRRYTPPNRISSIRNSIKENLTLELAGY